MTARELADRALDYREGKRFLAILDLTAALDGVPGAVNRFGSDRQLLAEAKVILEG